MLNNFRSLCLASLLSPSLACAKPTALPGWDSWRGHFISLDGRVVGTGRGNIRHSEGLGVALVLGNTVAQPVLVVGEDYYTGTLRMFAWLAVHPAGQS